MKNDYTKAMELVKNSETDKLVLIICCCICCVDENMEQENVNKLVDYIYDVYMNYDGQISLQLLTDFACDLYLGRYYDYQEQYGIKLTDEDLKDIYSDNTDKMLTAIENLI